MKNVLRIERATLGYGKNPVLQDVDLSVQPGEILAIVGPNGVGKSTLVKGACGSLPLMNGEVMIGDQNLRELRPDRRAFADIHWRVWKQIWLLGFGNQGC